MAHALDFMIQLGSVDDVTAAAKQGVSLTKRPLFNSHVHFPPNFSAFESVEQALDLAQDQGIGVLGAGNYYDYSVYDPFAQGAQARGIFPLYGTEIISLERPLMQQGIRVNDPGNPGRIYICGKGITQFVNMNERARELLQTMRGSDTQRMATMIDKMAAAFKVGGLDTGLTEDKAIQLVATRHQCKPETIVLQERHVALAFQQAVCELIDKDHNLGMLRTIFGVDSVSALDDAVGLQGDIRTHLMKSGKPCFVPEDFLDFKQASELINALGGVVCYPVLADGCDPRCEYEVDIDVLITQLRDLNIHMVEFIPLRNQPEVLTEYVTRLRQAGFAVVAGTEHNTLDLVPIDPACQGGVPMPDSVRDILWEGTCVNVAHQFLTANGQTGFTDAAGKANADYGTAEERLTAFKAMGEAVLAKYFDTK